jgi:tyrosine aminotransferase
MILTSKKAKRTSNPIRNIVDNLNPPHNHSKILLNLALGDPTVHGNLFCPSALSDSINSLLSRATANGYVASVGIPAARKAIAAYHSSPSYTIIDDDVIITSGCSGAVDLAITALVDEGDNILVPKPCFPLYQVITESLGGHVKYYPLKVIILLSLFNRNCQYDPHPLFYRRNSPGSATLRLWIKLWMPEPKRL